MALRAIGPQRTGRMPSEKWEGGRDSYLSISRTGYRAGRVVSAEGEPVGGIMIGCIFIPTRRIVGHTVSDADGNYYFDGLREGVADYFFFAYPDAAVLGGEYEFATRWLVE